MQTQSTLLDDLGRILTGAMGAAEGVREEARSFMQAQGERFVNEMDLVRRDEFEAMKAIAQEAAAKVAALEARVAALEAQLGA